MRHKAHSRVCAMQDLLNVFLQSYLAHGLCKVSLYPCISWVATRSSSLKKWSGVTVWTDWACSVETLWRGGPTEGATRSHDRRGECACGERKGKEEQSVRHILALSPSPSPSLSLTHTHSPSHTPSLTPSSSQWRPWEESRYDASWRHTRGKTC